MSRRLLSAALIAAALGGAGLASPATPARADHPAFEMPNLSVRPAWNLRVGVADRGTGTRAIRFATTSDNIGAYPLELLGAPPRDAFSTVANQCTDFTGRLCVEYREIGTFVFHPTHQHWHLDDYAVYELRRLNPDRSVDTTPAGLVSGGGKVSFCLLDYERTEPRPFELTDPLASTGYYNGCTGLMQGISNGWADTYDDTLAGQQLVIDGVADGDYAIVIHVDPSNILIETTKSDNVSVQRVRLSNAGRTVSKLP